MSPTTPRRSGTPKTSYADEEDPETDPETDVVVRAKKDDDGEKKKIAKRNDLYPVGTRVYKHFKGHGYFQGHITKAIHDAEGLLYKVEYEDGDVEEITNGPDSVKELQALHQAVQRSRDLYPVGTKVYKHFEGHGYFGGEITKSILDKKGLYYKVEYEDGDAEEITDADDCVAELKQLHESVKRAAQLYPVGTRVLKSGTPLEGAITKSAMNREGLFYRVEYEDGTVEEVTDEAALKELEEAVERAKDDSQETPKKKRGRPPKADESVSEEDKPTKKKRARDEESRYAVGTKVLKKFPQQGDFEGEIVKAIYDEKGLLYKVVYEDGDSEEITGEPDSAEELKQLHLAVKRYQKERGAGATTAEEQAPPPPTRLYPVGTKLLRKFVQGEFEGSIVKVQQEQQECLLSYKISYKDGDQEEITSNMAQEMRELHEGVAKYNKNDNVARLYAVGTKVLSGDLEGTVVKVIQDGDDLLYRVAYDDGEQEELTDDSAIEKLHTAVQRYASGKQTSKASTERNNDNKPQAKDGEKSAATGEQKQDAPTATNKEQQPEAQTLYPVGTRVYKHFVGTGDFEGEIVQAIHSERGLYYKVKYEDGEQEEITNEPDSAKELKELHLAVKRYEEKVGSKQKAASKGTEDGDGEVVVEKSPAAQGESVAASAEAEKSGDDDEPKPKKRRGRPHKQQPPPFYAVGTKVYKFFSGNGDFKGEIVEAIDDDKGLYYKVVYEDGDLEEITGEPDSAQELKELHLAVKRYEREVAPMEGKTDSQSRGKKKKKGRKRGVYPEGTKVLKKFEGVGDFEGEIITSISDSKGLYYKVKYEDEEVEEITDDLDSLQELRELDEAVKRYRKKHGLDEDEDFEHVEEEEEEDDDFDEAYYEEEPKKTKRRRGGKRNDTGSSNQERKARKKERKERKKRKERDRAGPKEKSMCQDDDCLKWATKNSQFCKEHSVVSGWC